MLDAKDRMGAASPFVRCSRAYVGRGLVDIYVVRLAFCHRLDVLLTTLDVFLRVENICLYVQRIDIAIASRLELAEPCRHRVINVRSMSHRCSPGLLAIA